MCALWGIAVLWHYLYNAFLVQLQLAAVAPLRQYKDCSKSFFQKIEAQNCLKKRYGSATMYRKLFRCIEPTKVDREFDIRLPKRRNRNKEWKAYCVREWSLIYDHVTFLYLKVFAQIPFKAEQYKALNWKDNSDTRKYINSAAGSKCGMFVPWRRETLFKVQKRSVNNYGISIACGLSK